MLRAYLRPWRECRGGERLTGPRPPAGSCLGNNFSLLETHVMTAMLARRFKLRLKPGHVPRIDMFGTLGSANCMPM